MRRLLPFFCPDSAQIVFGRTVRNTLLRQTAQGTQWRRCNIHDCAGKECKAAMISCVNAAPAAFPPLAFFGGAGAGEILLVLLVLLLLFGARRLPELARSLGRAIGELRRASQDLTREVMLDAPPPARPPPAPEDQTAPDDELPPPQPPAPAAYQG